jgi:glyoxylase-like metal-dependent hydrolase (beta-lactamase superfamily II)
MTRAAGWGATAVVLLVALASNAGAESWCDTAPAAGLAALEFPGISDDWFKVYEVEAGVFAISEPRQYEGVNSFLILGSRRAILFDTGLGVARIGDIVSRITKLPPIVINSHTHFDHVGGNHEFADVRNLGVPFSLASARGEIPESLRAYASRTLAKDRVCGPLPAGVASREYAIPTWQVAARLQDGERFDLGDRVLEVLRVPGHTPDSLCLIDRANGLLFTGDTYYSGEIYLWAPETSVAAYAASIDKLVRTGAGLKRLLPAHGPPATEPRRLMELQDALRDIRAGTASFEPAAEGRRLYRYEHFSILTDGGGT